MKISWGTKPSWNHMESRYITKVNISSATGQTCWLPSREWCLCLLQNRAVGPQDPSWGSACILSKELSCRLPAPAEPAVDRHVYYDLNKADSLLQMRFNLKTTENFLLEPYSGGSRNFLQDLLVGPKWKGQRCITLLLQWDHAIDPGLILSWPAERQWVSPAKAYRMAQRREYLQRID